MTIFEVLNDHNLFLTIRLDKLVSISFIGMQLHIVTTEHEMLLDIPDNPDIVQYVMGRYREVIKQWNRVIS